MKLKRGQKASPERFEHTKDFWALAQRFAEGLPTETEGKFEFSLYHENCIIVVLAVVEVLGGEAAVEAVKSLIANAELQCTYDGNWELR